jgi:hypothetical protein
VGRALLPAKGLKTTGTFASDLTMPGGFAPETAEELSSHTFAVPRTFRGRACPRHTNCSLVIASSSPLW